jgi:acyl carrier protein
MDPNFVSLLKPFLPYMSDQEITEHSRLRDLGLTSMREIELLFAVEDAYGVQVPDEKLTDGTFETSGQLWAVINDLRTQTGSAI